MRRHHRSRVVRPGGDESYDREIVAHFVGVIADVVRGVAGADLSPIGAPKAPGRARLSTMRAVPEEKRHKYFNNAPERGKGEGCCVSHESSRGHKIDGTIPNQAANFGDKQGKQTEENGQESNQQRTSSR